MTATDETRRFFGVDSALFLGPLPAPSRHSHHVVQGCVALDGRLEAEVAGREAISAAAILIGPDVPHAVCAAGLVAHFYALPESRAGGRLVEALSGRPWIDLGEAGLVAVRGLLRDALEDERRFPECLDALLDLALRDAPAPRERDERVRAALDSLRLRSPDTPLAELAREVGLSPDRLRHLIREQLGIPLRRYRRWLRLLAALEALRDTGSVTDAAHASGFADSAHLCRVFRESFTFPPGVFLRDSRFVQAGRRGSA